ncbi:hypothetical protein O9X98_05305 [Agrobacterium salinitolerans]|nr:hypothetical protein [Agrobacterium salinitolerans]
MRPDDPIMSAATKMNAARMGSTSKVLPEREVLVFMVDNSL